METAKKSQTSNFMRVADELKHLLADTYLLQLKTQNFHWNVKSPQFHALHAMFEEQYKDLAGATDEIAERIRMLNVDTPASFSHFLKLTSLKEENGNPPNAPEMIKQLAKDHETMITHIHSMTEKAESAGDEGTVDLLVQRLRAHQKTLWMLKSSLS